jgi:hypothetical protein
MNEESTDFIIPLEFYCPICLDSCDDDCNIALKCCNGSLHSNCFYIMILSELNNCPLCRANIVIENYYTAQTFILQSKNIPVTYMKKYKHNYHNIVYNLSHYKYHCCGMKLKSIRTTLSYAIKNTSGLNVLLYVFLYFCIYALSKIHLQES